MGATAWLGSHAAGDLMAVRVFRNLGLKLLAVALGVTVWYLVAGEQIVERALRIPLEFVNLPAQLELVGDAPAVVDVRVRGSSGALSRRQGRFGRPGEVSARRRSAPRGARRASHPRRTPRK